MNEISQTIGSQVETCVMGPISDVDARVQQLFRAYPAIGYGTRVVKSTERDGYKHVVVRRSRSCD